MAEGGEDMPEIKVEEVEETTTMYRVYVGNLDQAVDEGTLRGLFEEHGIAIGTILKKKNYAFIDCADQNNVERAINQLNDYNLLGSVMQVEASTSRRRKSNKIAIQNLPVHIKRDEVEALVSGLGNLVRCEQGPEGLVYVTFETQEQAQQAVSSLHGLEYQGVGLKVEIAGGMGPGGGNKPRRGGPRINNQNQGMNRQELPLRKSNKIAIQNLPVHIKRDEVEALVSGLGNLVRCEQGPEGLVYVTFETQEQAQQAVSSLHGLEYQGVGLKQSIRLTVLIDLSKA
uniref:Insulin-like growth factor 2 mRNA-binding protein 3 n=1 Tax=Magallana gigas TaxID=29159 RepID=K1RI55_MAGGI